MKVVPCPTSNTPEKSLPKLYTYAEACREEGIYSYYFPDRAPGTFLIVILTGGLSTLFYSGNELQHDNTFERYTGAVLFKHTNKQVCFSLKDI